MLDLIVNVRRKRDAIHSFTPKSVKFNKELAFWINPHNNSVLAVSKTPARSNSSFRRLRLLRLVTVQKFHECLNHHLRVRRARDVVIAEMLKALPDGLGYPPGDHNQFFSVHFFSPHESSISMTSKTVKIFFGKNA